MLMEMMMAAALGGATLADSLEALFDKGRTWPAFVNAIQKNYRADWDDVIRTSEPPDSLVSWFQGAGRWRLLVVAEDWCLDSRYTVPHLAKLAERAPNLELRIVNRKEADWLLERYPVDGKASGTPLVVVIDSAGSVAGTIREYPTLLREYLKTITKQEERRARKREWYLKDGGRAVLLELREILIHPKAPDDREVDGPSDLPSHHRPLRIERRPMSGHRPIQLALR